MKHLITLTLLAGLFGCTAKAVQPTLPDGANACPEPRPAPGELVACPMIYLPVCGVKADGTELTRPNDCSACSDPEVIGYFEGACAE